jgi:hypothetical protein
MKSVSRSIEKNPAFIILDKNKNIYRTNLRIFKKNIGIAS